MSAEEAGSDEDVQCEPRPGKSFPSPLLVPQLTACLFSLLSSRRRPFCGVGRQRQDAHGKEGTVSFSSFVVAHGHVVARAAHRPPSVVTLQKVLAEGPEIRRDMLNPDDVFIFGMPAAVEPGVLFVTQCRVRLSDCTPAPLVPCHTTLSSFCYCKTLATRSLSGSARAPPSTSASTYVCTLGEPRLGRSCSPSHATALQPAHLTSTPPSPLPLPPRPWTAQRST